MVTRGRWKWRLLRALDVALLWVPALALAGWFGFELSLVW